MSVLFSLPSAIFVLLLIICTATHVRAYRPTLYTRSSPEMWKSFLYKCSVVGDRLSPWVAATCALHAFYLLLWV